MKKRILFSLLSVPAMLLAVYLPSALSEQEAEAAYAPYQVVNGGFETGNLNGWTSHKIWKGEDGMSAWSDARVINTTYFSGYTYNRDGNYNLGITWPDASWDQSSERIGHLRSSNFILGGSGWISFKLGGGKTTSLAYVSVRRTSDNVEVARFGNRWFNNTAEAARQLGTGVSNAEAFMYKYYYNLNQDIAPDTPLVPLGTSLYIVLTDSASYDWCILSADSFVTYYSSAPTYHENELAVNIVPTILLAGSATASIPNGYFNTDLSEWSNPDGIFKIDANTAISSQFGNGGLGVFRSSAFKVTSDLDHIRFKWAGMIGKEKRVFVMIKEVGTNIEKLRFVKRSNVSSDYASGDFQNHMLTLTTLNYVSEYYLEFVDNVSSGDWSVAKIDEIRLITDDQYNNTYGGSGSGDNAVSITGIPLLFSENYVQEAATYGAYFIDQTASYCAASNGGNVPWSTLKTEYSGLSNDAKNYFVNVSTTETNVVAARDRFVHLWNKYHLSHETWTYFLVDASNNPYTPASANPNSEPIELATTNLYLVGVAGVIFLCGIGGYFLTRRRHA